MFIPIDSESSSHLVVDLYTRSFDSFHTKDNHMRVLCVAEKPSISKSISQILSGGQFTTVRHCNSALLHLLKRRLLRSMQHGPHISRTMSLTILKLIQFLRSLVLRGIWQVVTSMRHIGNGTLVMLSSCSTRQLNPQLIRTRKESKTTFSLKPDTPTHWWSGRIVIERESILVWRLFASVEEQSETLSWKGQDSVPS